MHFFQIFFLSSHQLFDLHFLLKIPLRFLSPRISPELSSGIPSICTRISSQKFIPIYPDICSINEFLLRFFLGILLKFLQSLPSVIFADISSKISTFWLSWFCVGNSFEIRSVLHFFSIFFGTPGFFLVFF